MNNHDTQTESSEGDFYVENGAVVFTSAYLLRRGFCCQCGCRHCPYREVTSHEVTAVETL